MLSIFNKSDSCITHNRDSISKRDLEVVEAAMRVEQLNRTMGVRIDHAIDRMDRNNKEIESCVDELERSVEICFPSLDDDSLQKTKSLGNNAIHRRSGSWN